MATTLLVFTDLDGTLLDHRDYSYEAARPALDALRSRKIPLILCSSKTAAEISPLREELGFSHCEAVVENGAGLLAAGAAPAAQSDSHRRLLAALDSLPVELRDRFSGFSSWTVAELQDRTGLDRDGAERAMQRQFSEPGTWSGDEESKREFVETLRAAGIVAQQGGRFLTLSFGGNKADRLLQIAACYRDRHETTVVSVALGDAANDIDMLQAADFGIIVPNPAHAGIGTLSGESQGRIARAELPGPAGWSASLLALLDEPESINIRGFNV